MRVKRTSNRVVEIEAGKLAIHPTAQKQLNPTKLKEIMEDFDLDAVGTIHVVKRQTTHYVIDGQHRVISLVKLGFGEWPLRCEVHNAPTDADASALFLRLNNRGVIGPYDKFVNEVYSGEANAVGAKRIIESRGLKIDRQAGDGNVVCVATIKKVFTIDGGRTLLDVTDAVLDAWGPRQGAVEGKIIEGLSLVYSRFNGELDRPQLVKKLAKYPGGPAGLTGDARGISKLRGTSVAKAVAEQVVETYNRGRRETHRLETIR